MQDIGFAGPEAASAATEILREAARWLIERDRALWSPEQFSIQDTADHAARGALVVAREDGVEVACMFADTSDPVCWPDRPEGSAFYLHKIAVRRSFAGRGWSRRLVDWAGDEARRRHIPALRLDCDPRPELIGLYRSLDFKDVDDYRTAFGFVARRFEKVLA
ncbi:MAG: GNAT family N-acetyltransferase [Caulobacterales bacterium]